MLKGLTVSLSDSRLRGKIAFTILVNAVLFLLVLAALEIGIWSLLSWWLGDSWWALLAKIAAAIGVLFVSPVIFALSSSLIAPVFGQRIFDTARDVAGAEARSGGLSLGQSIQIEIRRLLRFVGWTLLLLPLNLVPVLGSLAYVPLQAGLSAWTLGWDLMAYHYELHGMNYDAQRRANADGRGGILALGAVALVLTLIPVLQLLTITTNIAGVGFLSAALDAPDDV